MINTQEFIERIQKVLDYYHLSASSFADAIGVQRSSISHILSGRNKPSLDFVMKILHAFPDVELYWLLNGKGSFPKDEGKQSSILFEDEKPKIPEVQEKQAEISNYNVEPPMQEKETKNSNIDRIVIFYNDGTFEVFNNK